MKVTDKLHINLQLFAEGGAAAGDGASSGDSSQAAAVDTGDNTQVAAEERAAQYAKFKAEFKTEYDAEVQGIVKDRLKKATDEAKAAKSYRDKTSRVFDALSVKYGKEATDIDGILAAVDGDNSYYEDEALKRGMDVKEFRQMEQLKKENAQLKAREAADSKRAEQQQRYEVLLKQVDEVKAFYPNFDFKAESESNPMFKKLCVLGVPMKNAYETTHMDEIMAHGMQYAAKQAEAKFQASAKANSRRPDENGLNSSGEADTKVDVGNLSLKQMEEAIAQARSGKKITFK